MPEIEDVSINTDVDRLIRYVAKVKRASVDEISHELGMAIPTVKRWLSILEQ